MEETGANCQTAEKKYQKCRAKVLMAVRLWVFGHKPAWRGAQVCAQAHPSQNHLHRALNRSGCWLPSGGTWWRFRSRALGCQHITASE